ncbi:MAG: M23 family metallopeptidase [Elusimicrobiota bacterium]
MNKKNTMFKSLLGGIIFFSLPVLPSGCKSTATPPQSLNVSEKAAKVSEEKVIEKSDYEPELTFEPVHPVQGNFTILKVGPLPNLPEIKVETELPSDISLPFWYQKHAYIFLGTSYRSEPGEYEVKVFLENLKPENLQLSTRLKITPENFPVSRFSMPPSRTSGWTDKKLLEARKKVTAARNKTVTYPLWTEAFIWPLKGRISSEFGALRIINGNNNYHGGIDIAEPGGTPVKATNAGIVRLSDNLPAQGRVVILDHGLDISSSYLHLNTIKVKENQKVEAGEIIGTVGMTGYATGNHLHWSMHIGYMPVNPEQFVQRDLKTPFSLPEEKVDMAPAAAQ